jgi:hypothetical protein
MWLMTQVRPRLWIEACSPSRVIWDRYLGESEPARIKCLRNNSWAIQMRQTVSLDGDERRPRDFSAGPCGVGQSISSHNLREANLVRALGGYPLAPKRATPVSSPNGIFGARGVRRDSAAAGMRVTICFSDEWNRC